MSWLSDFQDLVDVIEATPGWRVVTKGQGLWTVYPPIHADGIIHCNASADVRSLDNFKARLRRANFPPLMRAKNLAKEGNKEAPAATPAPRDLIAEARTHVSTALDSLAKLDSVLGEIADDQASIAKIRELFQRLSK